MKPKRKLKRSKLSAILADPCRSKLLKMQEEQNIKVKDPAILQAIHKAKMERSWNVEFSNHEKSIQEPSSSQSFGQSKYINIGLYWFYLKYIFWNEIIRR